MRPNTSRNRTAFNLMEVLVAMAIFAIGFAMIAGVVPAGHLLNRRTEDDVLAIIASKNVVAVIEAKKIFTPAWEHTYTHDQINEGAYPAGTYSAPGTPQDLQASARGGEAKSLEGSLFDIRDSANVNVVAGPSDFRPNDGDNIPDWEDRLITNAAWPAGSKFPGSPSGIQCRGWLYLSQSFRDLYDTNGDGNPGNGAGEQLNLDDCTDMKSGRIHAFHNRVGYSDIFPSEDVTYPTYITTLANRDYLSSIVVADLNANPNVRRWTAAVAVLRRHAGDTWPERGTNPALGGCSDGRPGTNWPRLVTPQNGLKSIEGNNHPNNGWPNQWGYWNTYCVSGNDTDPNIPGLYNLPMIVYDWSNNLIEAQYPECWTPGAFTPFVDASVDRRMSAGDRFIAREGGTIFTVISTRDVGSDKRYQIIEVYPALRTTLLGPNSDPNWRLREGYFAPRPAQGGASPLIRIELISAARGFTSNANH